MFSFDDNRKIGIGLLLAGMILIFLGVLFLFDRALFILGNLCFLLGLYFIVGIQRTLQFFTRKGKAKGSAIYFIGLFIIVFGFPFIGFCVKMYGLFLLFKSFFPFVYDQICRIPVIGRYFNNPTLKNQIDKISQKNSDTRV